MEVSIVVDDWEEVTHKSLYNYAKKVQKRVLQIARQEYSREVYALFKAGLSTPPIQNKDFEVLIYMDGWLPCALEGGIESFDMKPGLLASPKAQTSKTGSVYMHVPMGTKRKPEFRTVSTNSKADSWIHPGFKARNLFEQAVDETEF